MKNQKSYRNPFAFLAQSFAPFAVKKKSIYSKLIVFSTILLIPGLGFSQEIKLSERITTIAEQLAANESDPDGVSLYIERLQELSEDPADLNNSNEEEISRLFFLTDFQVKSLIDYIKTTGKVASVYELANIPGFDRETVETMLPFISLEKKNAMNYSTSHIRNNLITNIIYSNNNQDTSFIGSPLKVLTKYRFSAGSFSGGVTAEKDPGEKFLSGSPPATDFLSAHLSYTGTGIIRKIIIGDYSVRFGLGSNINSGFRTGISLSSPGFLSSRNEIRPYTSTDENSFFRGFSSSVSYKFIDISFFYSLNKIDATLTVSETYDGYKVRTFVSGGIHNTLSLAGKKDNVTDKAYGINLSGNYKNIRLGFTWSGDKFSLPKEKDSKPEAVFDFEGNRNNVYTISYNGLVKRNLLFGEVSVNDSKNRAFIQGLSMRPSDRLSLSFIYRNYSPAFFTFHGKGPGQGSETKNENGIAGTFSYEAAKHLFISGGADVRRYDWLRYRCSAPSEGFRKELRIRYEASSSMIFDASYLYNLTITDNSEETGIARQSESVTRSIRLSSRYLVNDNLTLTTRIDYKCFQTSRSKGFLLLQDLSYRFRKIPLSVWYRYCLFKTNDWNSRLYVYENDLLYSFSIPALSDTGSRSYIMAKYDFGDFAEIRIKYGTTFLSESPSTYENRDEIKFQIKLFF